MFSRLYGETELDQLVYLEKRILISLVLFVIGVIGLLLNFGPLGLLYVLVIYYWGWGALKAMFGFTTLGVIFGRSVVLAAIFIVAFLMIGGLAGIVCFLLGTGRYIYLKVKQTKEGL